MNSTQQVLAFLTNTNQAHPGKIAVLRGDWGSGKVQYAKAYFDSRCLKHVNVALDVFDTHDFCGYPHVENGKLTFSKPRPELVLGPETGVLLDASSTHLHKRTLEACAEWVKTAKAPVVLTVRGDVPTAFRPLVSETLNVSDGAFARMRLQEWFDSNRKNPDGPFNR